MTSVPQMVHVWMAVLLVAALPVTATVDLLGQPVPQQSQNVVTSVHARMEGLVPLVTPDHSVSVHHASQEISAKHVSDSSRMSI